MVMQQRIPDLPSGYRLAFHGCLDSTNAEALRRAERGTASGLWIWAKQQKAGKGRAGRDWSSPPGNLYASLLLRPQLPLTTLMQLSLLAGVAIHDTVKQLTSSASQPLDLRLKWPNDILLGGAKLGGILLETASSVDPRDTAVVIGVGLNLSHAPNDLGRSVACLADAGHPVTAREAFPILAWRMADWIARWQDGQAFGPIRSAWMERAQPIGQPISVNLGNDRLGGTFLGIDEAGALRLALAGGQERRITAGDVAIGVGE